MFLPFYSLLLTFFFISVIAKKHHHFNGLTKIHLIHWPKALRNPSCMGRIKDDDCYFKEKGPHAYFCCKVGPKGSYKKEEWNERVTYSKNVFCDCDDTLCPTTTSKPTQKPKITTHNPIVNSTKKPGKLKCFSCETHLGDTDCLYNPKSTKIIFCKKGQICRTTAYKSTTRGFVLTRDCTDPDTGLQMEVCTKNVKYLPRTCDAKTCEPLCGCLCDTNLCNNRRYPNEEAGGH